MIWSKYNYLFISKKNEYLLYNSMTNNFAEIDKEAYEILSNLSPQSQCSEIKELDAELFEELFDAKYLVESDEPMLNSLKLNSYLQRFDKNNLSLTIAPTLKCNFSCPYCFEENRKNIHMSDDTEEQLINFIKSYGNINHLSITWYGGEPLLAFDRIKSISKKLKQIERNFMFVDATYNRLKELGVDDLVIQSLKKYNNKYYPDESSFWNVIKQNIGGDNTYKYYELIKENCTHGLRFSAHMISNGYLLSKERVDELLDLHINKIQITLDGNEETHNKRRNVKNGNSFQTILKNLDYLFEKTNKIQIAFRISVDETNKDQYAEINNMLVNRYRGKNMFIYPGFIYSTYRETEGCASIEGCHMDRETKANFLIEQADKIELSGNRLYYPRINRPECMARRINSFLIDARGDVYKCWDDIGIEERIISNIHREGIIKVNSELNNKYLVGNDVYSNAECLDCFYLPICGGGCPYMRVHNADVADVCVVSKDKINDFLETHFEEKKRRLRCEHSS